MADNAQLDTFLAAGTPQEGAEAPAAPPAPEHPPEASEAAPEAAAKPSEAEPQDEDVAPHSGSDNRTVPFSALEKVRNDWKSKYAAEQARAELLAKQLEEAKRPPPQQAVPQPMPLAPIDPVQDPHGFMMRMQQVLLNERLNNSEERLREKLGPEKVDEYVAEFKELAARDQALFPKLYQQTNPYSWMQKEVERQRVLRDVGDDPTAYEQKLRAKWEAEKAEQPMNGGNGHAVSPAAGLAPSLANVRSVAGRTTTAFTGPPPLEALFPGHNRRDQRR